MFTNVINKQSFEFFCTSETTAALVRSDIELYTIKQFNAIIENVFLEINPSDQLLKIDKIEINLGDITVGGMRTTEVFSNFKRILTEKINEASSNDINNKIIGDSAINYSNKIYGNDAAGHSKTDGGNWLNYNNSTDFANVDADSALSAETQRELELIQSVIVNGELPWWVTKNSELSINSIVQNVIHSHPETLKKLLQEFTQTPELVNRLFVELKPATVLQMTELMGDFSSGITGNNSTEHGNRLNNSSVFEGQIEKFREAFESHSNKRFEKDKKDTQEIKDLLIKIINRGLWPEILNNLHGIAQLKLLTNNSSFNAANERKLDIEQVVELLSVFEREFLLFELTKHSIGIKSIQDYAAEFAPTAKNDIAAALSESLTEDDTAKRNTLLDTFTAKSASGVLLSKTLNAGTYNKPDVYNKSSDAAWLSKENNGGTLREPITIRHEKSEEGVNYFNAAEASEDGVDNTLADSKDASQQSFLDQEGEKIYDLNHEKAVAFIMRKLKSKNAALYKYLQFLSTTELQNLAVVFKQRDEENKERLLTVKKILEHPYLFKYNILGVLVHLLTSEKKEAANTTDDAAIQSVDGIGFSSLPQNELSNKSASLSNLYKPEAKDIFVLKDILKKYGFDTENEKNIARKALYNLTYESFNFINFLTELPVNEIEKMSLTQREHKHDNIFFDNTAPEKKAYIENAGLCLLAPYLPSFLKRLKYLENGKFKNKHIAIRAIYILQYMVSAKNKSPEYLLQFNKLLCGFKIEEPILSRVNLTKNEKLEADNLIASVIQNWKVLKNTSSKGFRESFLQRKGILLNERKSWTLRVEKKAYDILLDSIPWNYTMIKFAWMEKMILVEW